MTFYLFCSIWKSSSNISTQSLDGKEPGVEDNVPKTCIDKDEDCTSEMSTPRSLVKSVLGNDDNILDVSADTLDIGHLTFIQIK